MDSKPQRENSGVLFKNDRKTESTHPDYKGSINVEGKEFWLSGWIKQGASGKFLSVSVRSKDMLRGQHGPEKKPTPRKEEPQIPDDEIPW